MSQFQTLHKALPDELNSSLFKIRSHTILQGEMMATWFVFHSFGEVTIAGEELQILTYAMHLWPLSSEGSLHVL